MTAWRIATSSRAVRTRARVPNEYSTFTLPAGTTAWYHDLNGHYEAEYKKQDIAEVKAGQWAGPPVTFQLPGNAGYGSITEANLASYSGMGLESDGGRAWVVGLGHRQPLNYRTSSATDAMKRNASLHRRR